MKERGTMEKRASHEENTIKSMRHTTEAMKTMGDFA
jgi:hypothetical protein